MFAKRFLLLGLAALCLAGGLTAHVRLHNPSNKTMLWWPTPSNVTVLIHEGGSDNITDASHMTAMRNGFDAWNEDAGSVAQLVEVFTPVADPCAVWTQGTKHLIFFDEANCSGFFPGGSGTVAVTPLLFQSNGKILDADILFNGSGFGFTTDGTGGRFDVQDVGTHELGHLLGLDHSGWAGATMYPYVGQNLIMQRSISEDDVHGLRAAFPAGTHGTITGAVARISDASSVGGAHIFVRDPAGRTVGGALARDDGTFSVEGLDADTYTVGVNPLDFPVSSANLQSGRVIETDFEPLVGATIVVGAGQTVDYGTLNVAADVGISLGRSSDSLPLVARLGVTTNHTLSGSGLAVGSALTCSDPTITVGNVNWFGTFVTFQLTTPGGAQAGHADLMATNVGGDIAVLIAGVEFTPPNPTVTSAAPNAGTDQGGDALTITGTGFRPGARVILGENIYRDGSGCVVVNSTTITLTTLASTTGLVDIVVMDPTGVEGRDIGGFDFIPVPQVNAPFPNIGATGGGTSLALTGSNFLAGIDVRIDGVSQGSVVVESSTLLTVTTDAGIAGGPYVLEVENAAGGIATSAYSYVAQLDPNLISVSPAVSKPAGGSVVTITGANFTATSNVYFGADAGTGLGGTLAGDFSFINSTTIQVTSPAHAAGQVTVMIQDTGTGQASLLASAFTFKNSSGGGGGGGCSTAPVAGPPDGRGNWFGAFGFLAFLLFVLGSSRVERRLAVRRIRS